MGESIPQSAPLLPSAFQTHLQTYPLPADSPHPPHHHNLALQIAHNLRHQHAWTSLRLHTHSPNDPSQPLPRPLVSGLPPQNLYVHPDEQIAALQAQKDAGGEGQGMPVLRREREWVVPSQIREKWTLRRFGEVFDGVGKVPVGEGIEVFRGEEEEKEVEGKEEAVSEWREKLPKRVLLATLHDDSTVVYYIVHDGIVKPRQN